jgi:hypothetical protein
MTDAANKFGDWIKEGFDIYKNNLGLLSGPMGAGMILIVQKLRDGKQPPPAAGDVFQGFQYFLPSFLFCIVWGVILFVGIMILSFIPCLGQLLSICLCLAAAAFLMFGLFLIVEQKMDFWPASMASIEKVRTAFFPFLGLAVVASILGQIGALACGIGVFVTMPVYFTILAVTYRDVFGEGAATVEAPQAPAEPAEPAEPPPPPETPGDAGDDPQ